MGRTQKPTFVLALVITLGIACAPTAPTSPPTGGAAPAGPKVAAVQRLVWAPDRFDGHLDAQALLTGTARGYDWYETLVAQDNSGKPSTTGLAKSWKLLNPTTWQFELYRDSKFHDGSLLTAEDIKFSFDRPIKDPKLAVRSRILTVEAVEMVDQYTVNVKTTAPDPILLRRMAAVAIYPKAGFERLGAAAFSVKPIGSGPFKVKEFVANDHITLIPFTEHPRRKAKLQELVIKNVPEISAKVAGLRTGDLDYAAGLPFSQLETLKAAGLATFSVDFGRSNGWKVEAVLDTPLRSQKVRQAMNYAIDKDLIVTQIYGGFTKLEQGQVLQPEVFGFNPALKPYPYDPKKAKQLLVEAGYPNGFKIKIDAQLNTPETKDMTLLAQSQLREIGIETEINFVQDTAVWNDKYYGRIERAPILATGIGTRPGMDADFALVWFSASQVPGLLYYDNPEFERYYQASTTELDETKRQALIWKALEVFREDPPWVFTVQVADLFAHKKTIQGVQSRFDLRPLLENLWISE